MKIDLLDPAKVRISGEKEESMITFSVEDEELLTLAQSGVYVKGKLVSDDKEIYTVFKEWLEKATHVTI